MSVETIPALLAQRAEHCPHVEAVVGDDQRLTYSELDRRSTERAIWLVANGVNKGHRVALMMPNGVEWAVNAYAIMRVGAVLVPLSTLLRPPELADQLATAGVRHLIATPEFRGRDYHREIAAIDRATLPSLRTIWWAEQLGDGGNTRAQAIAAALSEHVCPADDMVVIFTSGSSGAPKGVIHTHGGAIRANAAGLEDRCVRPGTRIYLPMPLFWVGGFAGGLISALNAGATLLTEAEPAPATTLKFLQRERATLFRGWPDQAARIAAHPDYTGTDLSALQPGSLDALLPANLRSRPGSRARLFGMTETFGPFCGYPLDQDMPKEKWDSCGRPFSAMLVRIVDPDSGESLPNSETGSIQIGGHNILRGICGREREAVFTPDGWYDGGDTGWLDDDGFLFFAGRADDMIKLRGVTVYPAEVESALEAIPGIERAFATDISIDGVTSLGVAVVPCTPGTVTIEGLRSAAKQQLSAFKIPSRWLILDSLEALPRSTTGKVDKPALRSLIVAGNGTNA